MGIENEAKKDVSLGSKDAENVVGGAKKTAQGAALHSGASSVGDG